LVFAGHSHYGFFNRVGDQLESRPGPTRYFVAASTTFTRPGFGELFSSASAADHGRDDTPKLGFYLVQLRQDGIRVHFQRTGGEIGQQPDDDLRQRLVTLLPADLEASPLGINLRHTLTSQMELPAAWPSVVRQPVRNDYPLLAMLEVGARRVLVPVTDLDDPLQRERLAVLRDEGVVVTAWALWHTSLTPPLEQIARHRERLDGLTVHLLGSPWPDAACLEHLRRLREAAGCPVTLSTIVAREQVPGKQHDRSRHGYSPAELPELDRRLVAHAGPVVDRVLCRVAPDRSPWEIITGSSTAALSRIGGLDWLVELSTDDDAAHLVRVADALFASAAVPGGRLLLDPLVDLDRTMDTFHGLLDRRCNPRPPFHAARAINSLLFAQPRTWVASDVRLPGLDRLDGWRVRQLRDGEHCRWLIVPSAEPTETLDVAELRAGPLRMLRLRDATVVTMPVGESLAERLADDGPSVLWPASSRTPE
jgi:hypothetical protein